jgi:hypothetical protein
VPDFKVAGRPRRPVGKHRPATQPAGSRPSRRSDSARASSSTPVACRPVGQSNAAATASSAMTSSRRMACARGSWRRQPDRPGQPACPITGCGRRLRRPRRERCANFDGLDALDGRGYRRRCLVGGPLIGTGERGEIGTSAARSATYLPPVERKEVRPRDPNVRASPQTDALSSRVGAA